MFNDAQVNDSGWYVCVTDRDTGAKHVTLLTVRPTGNCFHSATLVETVMVSVFLFFLFFQFLSYGIMVANCNAVVSYRFISPPRPVDAVDVSASCPTAIRAAASFQFEVRHAGYSSRRKRCRKVYKLCNFNALTFSYLSTAFETVDHCIFMQLLSALCALYFHRPS